MVTHGSISVVIPCYCCAASIDRAVGSVLAQTLRPTEIILVDDKSPDDTAKYIRSRLHAWDDQVPTRLIVLSRNGGPSAARNRGIDEASGEYIALLDADDYWLDRKLEMQSAAMRNEGASFSFHPVAYRQAADEGLPDFRMECTDQPTTSWLTYEREYLWNRVETASALFRRNPVRFDAARRFAEDHDFWCRYLAHTGQPALKIERALGVYANIPFHRGGLSGNLNKMMIGQLTNIVKNRPPSISGFAWMAAAVGWSGLRYVRRIAVSMKRTILKDQAS